MERLTTNKNVSDMGMVELALNCCYIAKDGSGRYRDYEIDMDERDFVRKLTTTLVGEDLPLQDESFDEEMMDNLGIDPLADVRGLIAIFYRNMWAMAELREKLKRYEDAEEHGSYGKWIPVSERLPDDGDIRFYMCIVENHEEDLPMFCQYEEDRGFGFWRDYYDGDTLGFIDSEFQTNEELGYEKVVAWMPLPEPYRESEPHKQTNADRIRNMSDKELAEFLCKVKSDYQWMEHEFPSEEEHSEWEEWLQSEAD